MKCAQNLGSTRLPSEEALEPELQEARGGHWDGWRGLGRALENPARPSGGARAHCRALAFHQGPGQYIIIPAAKAGIKGK